MSHSGTHAASPEAAAKQSARIANWNAELTAKSDPKFREYLKRAGMTIVILAEDNWSATSMYAPWRK
jgi:hypothetical protein